MNSNLPVTFRTLVSLLQDIDRPLARSAAERLERDLLPRTAGGHEHLVAGIVGPNNAGKSQLFNSLAGRDLSPSEPQGGATRRLVGAACPATFDALLSEPSLAQFPIVAIHEIPGAPLAEAKQNADDPASLILVRTDEMPAGLVLIDAPDFDSILIANRRATESLLKVADLAIVVVTRHTYHNELVVSFLENWLRHGRPWALFYNEAFDDESITRGHAEQLSRDLGSAPVAIFSAPFDIELQRPGHGKRLEPRLLGGQLTLRDWLAGDERLALKARALQASTEQLGGDLSQLIDELRKEASLSADLLRVLHQAALPVGRAVAGRAMPPGPFLEAFRRVADTRIAPWRRGLRSGTRKLRLSIEGLSKRILGGPQATSQKPVEVAHLEARELAPEYGPLLENLGRQLAPGARFWSEHTPELAQHFSARLATSLASAASAGPPLAPELTSDQGTLQNFEERCEELIVAEFERRSKTGGRRAGESLVQFGVDLAHTLPIAAGVGTAIATGGLGADVATLFAGGIGAAMAERFTKFLGTGLSNDARQRWQELRGAALASLLIERICGDLARDLQAAVHAQNNTAEKLSELQAQLPQTQHA